MKNRILSLVTLCAIGFGVSAQNVNIPDANFKTYLLGNSAINTNMDAEIQVSEAASFTGNIFGNNLGISDLTGIEAFTSLTGLYCRDNNLGSIDISANTALTYLDCQNASLSALDISSNTALTGVSCPLNSISSLDVSSNTALWAINCSGNNLSSLDVSNNVLLSNFSCDNNNLSSLDVSNNAALSYFVCFFNNLTSIDLSNCTALTHFACSGNNISSLDVSNNTALGNLYCPLNNISFLDVSANTSLQLLVCSDNNLSGLNAANGNNVNMNTFTATGNPNLSCIQVDDDVWSAANWTNIDAAASFSLDCIYLVDAITVQGQGGQSTISTQGGTLQMEASVLPTYADDDTYTWSVANGTGSASISASGLLTAMTNGTVTVTATANDASGVTGTTDITITNQDLGVSDQATLQSVSIYPNPVNSELNIDSEQKIESIAIVNVLGNTVKTIGAPNNSIDVSELTKGIYFLQIQMETGLMSKKFIKE
jgi:hypothetical protein